MMSVFTSLLLTCLAVVVVASIIGGICRCGLVPLRKLAAFARRPVLEKVLVATIALGFIRYGSTKGTNGVDRSGDELGSRGYAEAQRGGGLRSDAGVSAAGHWFTGIERLSNSVALSVAWEGFDVPPFLEFFARTNLVEGEWVSIGWAEATAGATNLCVDIEAARLPGGAMPQTAFFAATAYGGVGEDGDDDDGDGLTNADERAMGTNPHRADTDGDGFSDGEEAACVSYGASLPDFDLSSLPNVLAGTSTYQSVPTSVAVDIPFYVNMAGSRSNRAVVHFEGIAAFLAEGVSNLAGHSSFDDPANLYATGQGAVAAYGCMFWPMGGIGSQLRAGTVYGTQGRWFVAEWRDMMHPDDLIYLMLARSTFLLAVSEADPSTVYVRYGTLAGSVDGSTGIVGAHGFGGVPDLLVGDHVLGSVTNGMTIAYRFGTGTDPLNADTDGDGLPDGWEAAHGMDPLVGNATDGDPRTDADADPDRDGLTNAQEAALGLDPFQPDTDGDGMDDGWEVRNGFDPATHNSQTARTDDDANADPDGDDLTNAEECAWNTNPSAPDSDGDGFGDGAEIAQGSDPGDATDGGAANSRAMVPFYFGDHSTSHSEKYQLTVSPVAGSGAGTPPRAFSWVNANYGECETRTAALKPGWAYEVRLAHAATNREQGPDYDYTLNVVNLPQSAIVSDPGGLLGIHSSSDTFTAAGKVAVLHVLAQPQIIAQEVVGVNNDDDNGNDTQDWEEDGSVASDDDIVEVTVSASCPPGRSGTVTVTPFVSMLVATLWKDLAQTEQVGASDSFVVPVGGTASRTYYLEGSGSSSSYLAERLRASLFCGGATSTNEHRFTVVERIAEPITTERSGGQVVNPCCAVVGAGTPMRVKVLPNSFPNEKIKWRVVSGAGSFSGGDTGRDVVFTASGAEGSITTLQVDVGDCLGNAPQFTLRGAAMHEVKIYPCAISDGANPSPITDAHLESLINGVNTIFRQVGLYFTLGAGVTNIIDAGWATNGLSSTSVANQIRNAISGSDGLELYFVPGSSNAEPVGVHNAFGIIVKNSADAIVLAHEFGHACGLYDIYCNRLSATSPDFESHLRDGWMPDDWSHGTGCRFYDVLLTHGDLVRRLIMHGQRTTSQSDIPAGCVWGLDRDGTMGLMSVGWAGMMTTSPKSL